VASSDSGAKHLQRGSFERNFWDCFINWCRYEICFHCHFEWANSLVFNWCVLCWICVYCVELMCAVLNCCVLCWIDVCCVELMCSVLNWCVLCWIDVYYVELMCAVLNWCVLCWICVYCVELMCAMLNWCVLCWIDVCCVEFMCAVLNWSKVQRRLFNVTKWIKITLSKDYRNSEIITTVNNNTAPLCVCDSMLFDKYRRFEGRSWYIFKVF